MSATPYSRRTVFSPHRRGALAARGTAAQTWPRRTVAQTWPPRRRSMRAGSTVSDGIRVIFIRNRTLAIRVAVTGGALAARGTSGDRTATRAPPAIAPPAIAPPTVMPSTGGLGGIPGAI